MATTTFRIGDMTIHRIIEMECGFTPALEFLPELTPETLAESRPWMKTPLALDDQDRLVLCFQAYIIRTGNTPSWSIVASATTRIVPPARSGT